MKKPIRILIAVICALSLVSCEFTDRFNVKRYEQSASISFSWWGTDDRNAYTLDALKEFEKQAGVIVNAQYCELSGYKNKLDVDVNAGSCADVVAVQYGWLYEYASQGFEFYDIYQLDNIIDLDNFTRQQLELGKIDGKLIAVPVSFNAVSFFYNSDTLKKYGFDEPKTWSELIRLGKRLKSEGVYAVELNEEAMWFSCVAYAQQVTGKPMFDKSGRFQYTSHEFEIMLEFYKELIDSNVTPRPKDFNHMDFYNGNAAGIACWISESQGYFSSNTGINANAVNITSGERPTIDSDHKIGWYKKPTAMYSINADTKNPRMAARLMNFLLNSEEMAVLQGTEKGIPLSRSALEVLESRDMLSDLQAVVGKKLQNDSTIELVDPFIDNKSLINEFFIAADAVTFSNTNAHEMGRQVYEAVVGIREIPK